MTMPCVDVYLHSLWANWNLAIFDRQNSWALTCDSRYYPFGAYNDIWSNPPRLGIKWGIYPPFTKHLSRDHHQNHQSSKAIKSTPSWRSLAPTVVQSHQDLSERRRSKSPLPVPSWLSGCGYVRWSWTTSRAWRWNGHEGTIQKEDWKGERTSLLPGLLYKYSTWRLQHHIFHAPWSATLPHTKRVLWVISHLLFLQDKTQGFRDILKDRESCCAHICHFSYIYIMLILPIDIAIEVE